MTDLRQRFERKIIGEPNTGCWLWLGALDACGYGRIAVSGKNQTAHRVSWEMAFGQIPAGLHVLHKCDVRCCVNPSHLFVGSHRENMQDAQRKGKMGNRWASRVTCKRGHAYSDKMKVHRNRPRPTRFCVECSNLVRRKSFKGG